VRLCWNSDYGPMPLNAEAGDTWRIIHVLSGADIGHLVFYVDDETGDLWRFVEDRDGIIKTEPLVFPRVNRAGPVREVETVLCRPKLAGRALASAQRRL
jgi:hypothetical protein